VNALLYVLAAEAGLVLMALAWVCRARAGDNHLSPWWLGSYGSLVAGFLLLTLEVTAAGVG
jgi:hypothetical protein